METVLKIATPAVAAISLVISLSSAWLNRRRWSCEPQARFLEKIIDDRIASYPQLWRITAHVYRHPDSPDGFSTEWAADFLREISD
jgi:hypothetical protein